MELAIQTKLVTKIYGSGNTEVVAMKDASMDVAAGEVIALLGPSGSGKSTFLTAVGLINPPTSGQVFIGGKLVLDGPFAKTNLRTFRRKHIGFVFQKSNLIPFLTAVENVIVLLELDGQTHRAAKKRAMELLDYLGVADRANNLPSMLSGGQQQRVAVARAIANRPSVILADEPTGNLDSDTSEIIYTLLRNINEKYNTTFIIITHDQRIAEKTDRIIEIKDGYINLDAIR